MKATYYLQCAYSPGASISVSVAPNAFRVLGQPEYNTASEAFLVTMT